MPSPSCYVNDQYSLVHGPDCDHKATGKMGWRNWLAALFVLALAVGAVGLQWIYNFPLVAR